MFFIYFIFGMASAIWLGVECYKNNDSMKWVLAALFIPFVLPFYFIKKMPDNNIIRLGLWAFFFIVFMLVQTSMLADKFEEIRYASPIEKQAYSLVEKLKKSADELDEEVELLEKMSRSESSSSKILRTIKFISELEKENLAKFQKNRATYSAFVDSYKAQLKREELGHLIDLRNFYDERYDAKNTKRFDKYINKFKKLLMFVSEHHAEIKSKKDQRVLKTYDNLYLSYRTSVDRFYKSQMQRIKYTEAFFNTHADLENYLPEKRELPPLFMWKM